LGDDCSSRKPGSEAIATSTATTNARIAAARPKSISLKKDAVRRLRGFLVGRDEGDAICPSAISGYRAASQARGWQ
jgi:hypothetical protein